MGGLFGGGGRDDAAMADAYKAQADAAIRSSEIASNAAKEVANAQLAGMKAQAEAALKASQNAAAAGIVGAALGAHTTTEEIVRRLPVESGAATIASWELAQKWNTTINMKQQGYQDVAIEYQLSGKSGSVLYKDPIWNKLYMGQKVKEGVLSAAQVFGIQSEKNPNGVPVTWNDFLTLNSLKRPEDMLKVDPQVAAARQREFAAWESQMKAQGMGLVVDLYKNPQLAGQSLEAMGGKEPLLDPRLAPLINSVTGGSDLGGSMDGLMQGSSTQYTDQINKLKEAGVIDANNMINGGALLQLIPQSLQQAPEFNPLRTLSQGELVQLQDQYNGLMNKVVDPKLIRQEQLGFGVMSQKAYNADGTVAASYLYGTMQMADGTTQQVAIQGNRLQEWYDMQSIIDGMGPTFPGMFAPRSNAEIEGVRTHMRGGQEVMPGSWNGGLPFQPGTRTPSSKSSTPDFSQNPYALENQLGGPERTPGAINQGSEQPSIGNLAAGLKGGTAPAPASPSTKSLGSSTVTRTRVPAGYEGAPLTAGE